MQLILMASYKLNISLVEAHNILHLLTTFSRAYFINSWGSRPVSAILPANIGIESTLVSRTSKTWSI